MGDTMVAGHVIKTEVVAGTWVRPGSEQTRRAMTRAIVTSRAYSWRANPSCNFSMN